jgi:hypothetical protein
MTRQKKAVDGPARRGGGSPWTTPEQLAWLESQLGDYRTAQVNNGVTNFLAERTEAFLEQWPLEKTGAAESASESTTEGDHLKKLKKVSLTAT